MPRMFALTITEDDQGQTVNRSLKYGNAGIENEVILTLVRNWLRSEEDAYHSRFKGKSE